MNSNQHQPGNLLSREQADTATGQHNGPKFSLGTVVATPNALQKLEQYGVSAASLLHRHQQGDWGDALDADDAKTNDRALELDERLLSSYRIADDCKVWVITEWDRSATTVLLPEDY